MGSHEKQRDGTGAGMTSDHRADIVNHDLLHPELVLDVLGGFLRVLFGVAMRDENHLVPDIGPA